MLRFRTRFVAPLLLTALVSACSSSSSGGSTTTRATGTQSTGTPSTSSSALTTAVSGTTSPSASTTHSTSTVAGSSVAPTTAAIPTATAVITITGSVTDTLKETADSASSCTPSGGVTNGRLDFEGAAGYFLVFTLATGAVTFPDGSNQNAVGIYNSNDSTQQWLIGSAAASTSAGTASFDGQAGTMDVDMIPHTPTPNPALKNIHVKGTFHC